MYTPELKRIFKSMKAPFPGFYVDVVEYPERKYLALRVYKPNIEEFSEPQKIALAEHLYAVQNAMRSTGARVFIEGVYDAPPNAESIRRSREQVGNGLV